MESPRVGLRRAAVTSWALIGVGTAGVIGATTLAYADLVKAPSSETAYPADAAPPINGPYATYATTSTSMAPSYSPGIHTRSHGS
jgi:periplasmic protein TonB